MLQIGLDSKQSALSSELAPAVPKVNLQGQPRSLGLQRALGNQALEHLLAPGLEINEPGDIYEQEADRVADQVMRMPAPSRQAPEFSSVDSANTSVQRKCGCAGGASCPKCEEEERVQRQSVPFVDSGETPSSSV